MSHMMFEYIMREDGVALIKGVVMIMDVNKVSMSHLAYMTPAYSKKMTTIGTVYFQLEFPTFKPHYFIQEAFPLLPKCVSFINVPSIFTSFFNFIKGIIKDKMKKRVYNLHQVKDMF
jgi:CRAL/TRIO domain